MPETVDCVYVEPFGGMASVLLARPRSRSEILNDRNERIINWWRVVRDRPDALADMVECSPFSRRAFEEAWQALDDPDPLRRAWALTVVLSDSFMHSDTHQATSWQATYALGCMSRLPGRQRLRRLADRMRNVQLECRDALDILEQTVDRDHAVVYCDPPYRSAPAAVAYGFQPEWDRMTELLASHQGRVAVSGYRDDWDHLGWRRVSLDTVSWVGVEGKRTEVLWFNYEAAQPSLFAVGGSRGDGGTSGQGKCSTFPPPPTCGNAARVMSVG